MKVSISRKKGKNCRVIKLDFSNKVLSTPTYFPAISSVEKNKKIENLIELIIKSSFPQMLISAFDYHYFFKKNKKLVSSLNKYSKKNFLFVDSGGYESYWNQEKNWKEILYKKTIPKIKSDFHTSYDEENNSKEKLEKFFDRIIDGGSLFPSSQYIPIFHAENSQTLLETLKTFLSEYPFAINFIAVREKELGFTISERAKTVFQIRKIIDKAGGDQILHVLGAGHPLSIALYSYCGADSFDSTDWFNHTMDMKAGILRDISQLELVSGVSPSVEKIKNPYVRMVVHNLDSYYAYMKKIQAMIKNNTLKQFLNSHKISNQVIKEITK